MERSNWWLSPVWEYVSPFDAEFNKALLKEVYEIGQSIEQGGTNGKLSLWDYDAPHLNKLKEYILAKCYQAVCGDISEVNELNLKMQYSMGWINVKGPGEGIEAHAHNDCSLTATYYVQAEENSGDIVFMIQGDAISADGSFIHNDESTLKHKHITPVAGKLVIFPAYIVHEVQRNRSNSLRISISTDLQQVVDKDAPNAMVIKSWCDSMKRLEQNV
jgi:uncharacterized protein (TIGR02466 family)